MWVGRRSHFFDVLFYIVNELGPLQLIKGREQVFFDFLLDGTEGVASMANARWGRSEVENSFQALVLEIDAGDAPEGRIGFEVEF